MKRVFQQQMFLFVFCLMASPLFAQISIAPTNLFIEDNARFGTYLVINNSEQANEISVEFFFGYSKTNSEGDRQQITNDTTEIKKHSLAEHIRAFPQNFILQPGQRQVVRLRITPPNNLEDGTYWARIKTTASPESPPIELSSADAVTARVGINIEQTTGLFFKKGNVSTGIEIENIKADRTEDGKLRVLTDLKRIGNSPFLGSITTSLINGRNDTVSEGFVSTSIYFDGTHRQELNISDVPAGEYTLQVHFESRRSDVSRSDLVQMNPVTSTTTITIP